MKKFIFLVSCIFALFLVPVSAFSQSTAPPTQLAVEAVYQPSSGAFLITDGSVSAVSLDLGLLFYISLITALFVSLFVEWLKRLIPLKIPSLVIQLAPMLISPLIVLFLWWVQFVFFQYFELESALIYGFLIGIIANAIYDTGLINLIANVFKNDKSST